jgi:transcriptional regulator with XRE-family HTH domain
MRERRLEQGLTQREVVGRLAQRGIRITNRALSTMENGRSLDLGLLPELADALDCTVTYLLGLAADSHSWRPDHVPRQEDRQDARVVRFPNAPGVLGALPDGFATPGRTRRN